MTLQPTSELVYAMQVAVALVKKLGTRFGRPMNVEAAYFADSLYNAWHMEHIECKNGVLLVISSEDREVGILHMPAGQPSSSGCWKKGPF